MTAPRDGWVRVGDIRLHYRDWGGTGELIVLLHGLASNCRYWDLVAPILSESFAVVALDQRGHGESDKPDDGYDFATVASDLRGFIGDLGLNRPLLVGHSWGGDVVLELAAGWPSATRGICLIDGGVSEISAAPGISREEARIMMTPPDLTALTAEQLLEGARSHWTFDASAIARLEGFLLASFEVQADGTVRPRLSRINHMKIVDELWRHKPSQIFSSVTCPVLLMPARQDGEGAQDDRGFRQQESIARAESLLPASKTFWMEDSIHDVPLQRPELVAKVIGDHVRNGFF
jgi:pimeloyl-ACP methyl ester carboxylesterase